MAVAVPKDSTYATFAVKKENRIARKGREEKLLQAKEDEKFYSTTTYEYLVQDGPKITEKFSAHKLDQWKIEALKRDFAGKNIILPGKNLQDLLIGKEAYENMREELQNHRTISAHDFRPGRLYEQDTLGTKYRVGLKKLYRGDGIRNKGLPSSDEEVYIEVISREGNNTVKRKVKLLDPLDAELDSNDFISDPDSSPPSEDEHKQKRTYDKFEQFKDALREIESVIGVEKPKDSSSNLGSRGGITSSRPPPSLPPIFYDLEPAKVSFIDEMEATATEELVMINAILAADEDVLETRGADFLTNKVQKLNSMKLKFLKFTIMELPTEPFSGVKEQRTVKEAIEFLIKGFTDLITDIEQHRAGNARSGTNNFSRGDSGVGSSSGTASTEYSRTASVEETIPVDNTKKEETSEQDK